MNSVTLLLQFYLVLFVPFASGCAFKLGKSLMRDDLGPYKINTQHQKDSFIDKSIPRTSSKSNPDCLCGVGKVASSMLDLSSHFLLYIHVYLGNPGDTSQIRTCTGTIINSNMILTSHQCLRKSGKGKINYADVWRKKGFPTSTLAGPKDLVITDTATLNHPHAKPKLTFNATDIIYREAAVYDLLIGKKYSESDMAVLIIEAQDFNNMATEGISPICLPRKGWYPTEHVVNLVGSYQGVRNWPNTDEKYRVGLFKDSKILRGETCNEMGRLNISNIKKDTLCLKFYQHGPNTEGGPLYITKYKYVSGDWIVPRTFLLGIANWVPPWPFNGPGHNYAFFLTLTYLEKIALDYKSEWCALPKPDVPEDNWPWEHYQKKPLTFLNCDCGLSNPYASGNGRIVGGEEAIPYEFPWMASIRIFTRVLRPSGAFKTVPSICGGSVINDRMILTAAHCFIKDSVLTASKLNKNRDFNLLEFPSAYFWAAYEFGINTHLRVDKNDENLIKLYAKKIYFHPGYAMENLNTDGIRKDFDIALVILNDTIKLDGNSPTSFISPLCLPKIGDVGRYIGQIATAAGWGLTNNSDPKSGAEKLRKTDYPIQSIIKCTTVAHNVSFDSAYPSETLFCAGYPPTYNYIETAPGDSGGPIFVKDKKGKHIQLGLVSHDVQVDLQDSNKVVVAKENAGFYTKVEAFLPYIYYYADYYDAKWCREQQ